MLDREKVIADAEKAIDILSKVEEPTFWCDFVRVSFEHTLELLKAQEPRVLTWDEMMALPHGREDNACVVLEEKIPVNRWDGGTIWKWVGAAFVQERAMDHRIYNNDSYGTVWRVWNTKPTKEQREAVNWDGSASGN